MAAFQAILDHAGVEFHEYPSGLIAQHGGIRQNTEKPDGAH